MANNKRDLSLLPRMKLLVVDDQGPVGEIISRIAQQGGWEAVHTVSPHRVEEIVKAEGIDVLLIDYAIDGNPRSSKNGLSVIGDLRAAGLSTPVVMFSGWTDLIDKKRARELSVIRVLEKPLSIQDLREALAEARGAVLAQRGQ